MLDHIQQRLERARAKRQRLGELLANVEREIDQLEAEHGRILSEQEAFEAEHGRILSEQEAFEAAAQQAIGTAPSEG